MTTFFTSIPAVYVDALAEDAGASAILLVNQDPAPGDTRVPRASVVTFDILAVDPTATVSPSTVQVWFNDAPVYAGNTFLAGYQGVGSMLITSFGDIHVEVGPEVDFAADTAVHVRVVASLTNGATLDDTYLFTTADTTPPRIVFAEAIDIKRVRVTFNEPIFTATNGEFASALDPADWSLARLGDYLAPVVSAEVVSAEVVPENANAIDLITDVPLTFGGNYRVSAAGVRDLEGNVVAPPFDTFDFLGFAPPQPEGRDFNLYRKLPRKNRAEDETQDLLRFIGVIQESADVLLYAVDRWTEILDPDTAPEASVDAMLADLGNPFAFDLTVDQKRRLVLVLSQIYELKGTSVGIISVIRFFLGLELTVHIVNDPDTLWSVGDGILGETTILGTSDAYTLHSFTVESATVLTPAQRRQVRAVVEYMRPAQDHFVRLIEPVAPVTYDHAELGYSRLGIDFFLHEGTS